MTAVMVAWRDVAGINRFGNMLGAIGSRQAKLVQVRAINRVGDMAKTQVTRALTKQTGLKRKIVVRAIGKPKRASFSELQYVMRTQGGEISLKYFRPRETRAGVTAFPRNKRTAFPGAFIRGGRFPNRVPVASFHGHVFERVGASRLPIEKVKSDVVIPVEMVIGATAKAFTSTVSTQLPRRVEHELSRLTGGVLS